MKPPIEIVTAEYLQLFQSVRIWPNRLQEVDDTIGTIMTHAARYLAVDAKTGVPWYITALIHHLECDLNFLQHLHNGDPLLHPTVNEPAHRPPHWDGSGTWETSAIDALQYDRLDEFKDWDVARACYELEQFNGWGYRFHAIHSPYLWAGAQHYKVGKYVRDGVFDSKAVSKQIGSAVLLFRMCERKLVALKGVLSF